MKSKQVIIIRKDLNMRRGKQISQACHASFKVFLDKCSDDMIPDEIGGFIKSKTFKYEDGGHWDNWLNGIFTKIVVSCNSEEELVELYEKAKNNNLPCSIIVDLGLTEFNNVPTKTAVAIGPSSEKDVNEITGHLKLL